MVKEKAQKPVLAVVLDSATKSALCETVKAIETFPEEWLGVPGMAFEAESLEQFQMDFVLCTDRLCNLPSDVLQTLYDSVRDAVALAAAEEMQPMICRGLELFGPDRSHLIARFRAPTALTQLRRTTWRACKEFGAAFPDAMWAPYIRLGRLKAARHQLNSVKFRLPAPLSQLALQPKGLTLLGKRPEDPYCECDWDSGLSLCQQRPDTAAVAATECAAAAGPRGASAPAGSGGAGASPAAAARLAATTPRSSTAPTSAQETDMAMKAAAVSPPNRPSGFVAELPKLRRPAGERGPGPARPFIRAVA